MNRVPELAEYTDEPSREPPLPERTEPAGVGVAEQARTRLAGGGASGDVSLDITMLAPNILSIRHWSRLLGGLLYATSPRLRWPALLRRTFDVDVLGCPKCEGHLRIVEAVDDTDAARQVLQRLGLPTDSPRVARARDPTTLEGEEPDA